MYQTSLPRCAAVGLVVFLFAVLLTPLVLHGQAMAVSVPDSSSNHDVIPVVVKDINTTDQGSQPGPKIILNGVAYFAAFDGWHGTELWRSDGTAAGTWLVKDVYEGSGSSSPEQLVATDDKLFFVADDGIHGQELWMSDGTSSGTVLVKDLTPDSLHTGIDQVTAVSDTLYFQTTSYPHGFKLWKSDGTLTGTVPLSYYRPSGLTNVAGWLYFAASNADSSIYGLWKTDGTSNGTVLLGQFPDFDGARPSGLTNVNGTMYFKAAKPISPTGYQYGLWRSDGTISGTFDIPIAGIVEVDDLTAVDDALFFTAVVNNGPDLLAKTDGTLTGTVELTRLQPIFNLTNVSGTLYFTRGDAELWKSDGTPADTVMLKDGFDFSWCNSYPPCGILELMAVGDRLYFRSSDGSTHGSELWMSDGTPAGTIQVRNIFSGTPSSYPSNLIDLNGTLLFTADDGLYGPELWRSDGTGTGTRLVTNIFNGTGHASPGSFVQVSDTVYFAASTDSAGRELWKTNGSATTTVLISDINPSGSSSPSSLVGMNGNLFFRALSSQEECGLWRSDGTLTGTTLIKSFGSSLNYVQRTKAAINRGVIRFRLMLCSHMAT